MGKAAVLKVLVAGCVALALQSCDFLGSRDFVRIGYSQVQLRELFEDRCDVPLADNEKVLNAYSGGGRHPSFWFQVLLDPQGGVSPRERLLERGYVVITERKYDVLGDTRVPTAIGSWWDPAVIEEATLFILQRTPVTPRAIPLVVCFLDERRGTLFAYSLPY
jgi:hypothetical protein